MKINNPETLIEFHVVELYPAIEFQVTPSANDSLPCIPAGN